MSSSTSRVEVVAASARTRDPVRRSSASRSGERVLELGYGPGWAIAEAVRTIPGIRVIGIDHSDLMQLQATRRNAAAVRRGQVTLLAGTLADLGEGEPFDKAYAVNVLMFLPDPVAVLRDIAGRLVPGGVVAVTQQPRNRGANDHDVQTASEDLAAALGEAGFANVRTHRIELSPVGAICVLGTRPAARASRLDRDDGSAA